MHWDAIAAVGEILGAMAVLATLVYLAVQVRHNAATAAAAIYESALSGFNDLNLTVASDAELASILSRGMAEPDSLDATEAVRFAFVMRSGANQFLKMLHLYKKGAISRREWVQLGGEATQIFSTPGGAMFRDEHPVYVELFDAIDRLDSPRGSGPEFGSLHTRSDGPT